MNGLAHRNALWLSAAACLYACGPSLPPSAQLQQQCDRDAGAWFTRQHPDGVTLETVDVAIRTEQFTYSDHYNPHLRRCMLIVSEEKSIVYPDKPAEGVAIKSLVDVTSGRQLGEVVNPWPSAASALRQCQVESRHCSSTNDFEELAAPYLER